MADAVIDPSYGFINYSNIKNDELLNEMLLTITDKNDFCYNKHGVKKSNNIRSFRKMDLGYVFYDKDKNIFKFPIKCSLSDEKYKLFSRFFTFVVHSEVSRFFLNGHFLEKFYKNYAKIYYSKMASTVRNYTVESISLKSTIFPFEAAFTDFINHYNDFDRLSSNKTWCNT